jgi:RIO-like serine/threonine protein kinase
MSYDLSVLRAMVRLSRAGLAVTVHELLVRAGGEEADVHASLRRLQASGLVAGTRLTLSGLAVAVSSMPPIRERRSTARHATRRAA